MGQESIDYYSSAVWLLKLTLPVCIVGYRTKTLNSLNVVESCTDQCHLHTKLVKDRGVLHTDWH